MKQLELATNGRIDELEKKIINLFKDLKNSPEKLPKTRKKSSVIQETFNISYGKLKKFRLDEKISYRKFGKEYFYDIDEINAKLESGELSFDS